MINSEDILSLEYLKKAEFSGSHQKIRYRLEGISGETGKKLLVTVWPEPYNFVTTPKKKKQHEEFDFSEEGIDAAVAWINDRL